MLYKWLLPVVFGAVKMEIVIFSLADVFSALNVVRYLLLLRGMSTVVGANKNHLSHLVGLLFPHIMYLHMSREPSRNCLMKYKMRV